MENNEDLTSKKAEEGTNNKPRSRLLLMKDRLKSQRKVNQGDKPSKSEERGSKSGESKKSSSKLSKSHSFTEADKSSGLSSAKKSLFGGGKHKKAQSAEMVLNGQRSYQSETTTTKSNPEGKNSTSSKNKKPSDPLRFFSSSSSKMPKSKSFDLDVAPLDEREEGLKLQQANKKGDGRLNKSLELESRSPHGGAVAHGGTDKKLSGILKVANGGLAQKKERGDQSMSGQAVAASSASSNSNSSSSGGRSIRSAIGSHFGFGFHGNNSKSGNNNNKSPAKENKKQPEKSDISYQIHRKIEPSQTGGKKSSSSVQYTLKPKIKKEAPLVNPDTSSGSDGGFEYQVNNNSISNNDNKQQTSPIKSQQPWKGSLEYLDHCQSTTTATTTTAAASTAANKADTITGLSLAVAVSTIPRTGRVPLPKSTTLGLSHHTDRDRKQITTTKAECGGEPLRNTMAAFHGRSVSSEAAITLPVSKQPQPQDRAPYLKMDFREGGHISSKSLSLERGGLVGGGGGGYQSLKYAGVGKSGPQYSEEGRSSSTSSRTSQDIRQDFPPEKRYANHMSRDVPYESARIPEPTSVKNVSRENNNLPGKLTNGYGYVEIPRTTNGQPHCQFKDTYSHVPPPMKNEEYSNSTNRNGPGHNGYYNTLPYHGHSHSSNARYSHIHSNKEPVYFRHHCQGDQTNRNSAIYHSTQSRPKPIIRQSQSLEDLLDSDCNNIRYNPDPGNPVVYHHRPSSKESVNSNATSQNSYDNCQRKTRGPYASSDYKTPRDNSCPPALDYRRVDHQNNTNTDREQEKPYGGSGGQNANFQTNKRNLQLSDVVQPPPQQQQGMVDGGSNIDMQSKQASPYSGVNINNNSYSSASDVSQYQDRIDALKTEFKKHFVDNNNEVVVPAAKVKDFSDLSNKLDAHIIMNENEGVYHVRRELGNIPDVARTGPTAYEQQNSNYQYLNKLNREKSSEDNRENEYSGVYSVKTGEPKVIPYGKHGRDHAEYVSSAQIQAMKAASGDYAVLYQGRVVPESNYARVEDLQKPGVSTSGNGASSYHHRNGSNDAQQKYTNAQSRSAQGYGDYGKLSRLERISEGDYDTLKEHPLDKIPEDSQESITGREQQTNVDTSPMKKQVLTPPHKKNGLKVTNPDDLKGQTGQRTPNGLRGSVLRRHTVTTGQAEQELLTMRRDEGYVRTKETLMEHLASNYPQHSHTIRGKLYDQLPYSRQIGHTNQPLQQTRNESYYEAVKEEDRLSSKSESESPAHSNFTRGGRLRSSLPIVRSPNKSLDKPMGLVFLIYRNETKRALLPNEVTSLDTIRALFVRAFCDQLNMRWFDGQGRKIYAMDPGTNVYYELEDLRDIKDRSVLKIYEPDFPFNIRSPSLSPHPREALSNNHHGYESDSSVRSAPPMVPRSPMHQSHPPPTHKTYVQDVTSKTASLPVQSNYAYHQPVGQSQPYPGAGNSAHHTTAGLPPSQGGWGSPTHNHHQRVHGSPTQGSRAMGSPTAHRPLSQVSPLARHAGGSPVRSPVHQNNRHSVAYLPPNSADFQSNQLPQSQSYHDYQDQRSSGSVTPSVEDSETRERMQRMEAQLASLTAMVQSAVVLKGDAGGSQGGSRPGSARSNSSLVSDTSCSLKSIGTSLTDSISDSTTPTLHSPSLSSCQGVSDSSTTTPQPFVSVELQNNMRGLYQRARELRTEVNKLRKLQVSNNENMQETIYDTFKKIKVIIEKVPGAADQPIRCQRQEVNECMYNYQEEAQRVGNDLSDLALSVDDLRQDVLTKGCRINKDEIQTMALTLSHISKSLGDLKCKFPQLQQNVKTVLAGEMEVVVREEKFLQREPESLDEQLKKCEKVMKVLLTLKRLGSVQEVKPLVQPSLVTQRSPTSGDRRMVLDNITAMAPDHGSRVASVEAAEAARERKKKITSNAESLRFEKALDQAQKQLRNTNIPVTSGGSKQQRSQQETRPELQELQFNTKNSEAPAKAESPGSPRLPLTDTTKRLSKVNLNNNNKESCDPRGQGHDKKFSEVSADGLKPSHHDEEDISGAKAQGQTGVSSPNVLNPNNTTGSSIQSQISRLSTFGLPGMTSTPNGEGQALPQQQQQSGKALSPGGSNGNKSQNNGTMSRVSFSSTVTEIPIPSSPSQDGVRLKKVPPPPPPRKSSRTSFLSPSSGKMGQRLRPQSGSPPTYENIENFPQKGQQSHPANKNPSSPPSRIPQVGGGGSGKPMMTRYQQELASGIYANMNRPDLQEQKIRPMEAVKTASLDRVSDQEGSGDSESSSEESQGTVKRRPASKETSPQPPLINVDSSDQSKPSIIGEDQSKDSKRLPPPPPVRKTSALSQNATEIQTSQSGGATKVSSPEGGSKIPKMSGGFLQKKLSNGDVKSAKSTRDKLYNETEIY